jgi:hypothetical protein
LSLQESVERELEELGALSSTRSLEKKSFASTGEKKKIVSRKSRYKLRYGGREKLNAQFWPKPSKPGKPDKPDKHPRMACSSSLSLILSLIQHHSRYLLIIFSCKDI